MFNNIIPVIGERYKITSSIPGYRMPGYRIYELLEINFGHYEEFRFLVLENTMSRDQDPRGTILTRSKSYFNDNTLTIIRLNKCRSCKEK